MQARGQQEKDGYDVLFLRNIDNVLGHNVRQLLRRLDKRHQNKLSRTSRNATVLMAQSAGRRPYDNNALVLPVRYRPSVCRTCYQGLP